MDLAGVGLFLLGKSILAIMLGAATTDINKPEMSICKSPKTVDVCVDYVCQNNVFDNKDDYDDDDEDEEYSSESQESIKNKACTPADITAIKNQLLRCNKDDIVKCIPELQQPKTESNVAAGEENKNPMPLWKKKCQSHKQCIEIACSYATQQSYIQECGTTEKQILSAILRKCNSGFQVCIDQYRQDIPEMNQNGKDALHGPAAVAPNNQPKSSFKNPTPLWMKSCQSHQQCIEIACRYATYKRYIQECGPTEKQILNDILRKCNSGFQVCIEQYRQDIPETKQNGKDTLHAPAAIAPNNQPKSLFNPNICQKTPNKCLKEACQYIVAQKVVAKCDGYVKAKIRMTFKKCDKATPEECLMNLTQKIG